MSAKSVKSNTFALVSLGCPKNLVDSERMAGVLQADGRRMVLRWKDADTVVVNTCGFIADARRESFEAIEELIERKRRGRLRRLIVAGCLVERDRLELLEKYPEIDLLIGVFGREEIARALEKLERGDDASRAVLPGPPSCPPPDNDRCRLTLRHLAYLKIAEGCNRQCSFCSIPRMRGPYASKPIEQVVEEAERLAADGVRELILIAQDTTFYGIDRGGRPQLAELLRRLDRIESIAWIRLMYLYPMHITEELLDAMAGSAKVVPYLDLPLQHINDEVLRRMRRRVSRDETEQLLDRLRRRIEGLVLRTTLLVGFPGETDAQFEELLEFVRRRRFERLGAFAFCPEPDTPAAELDGQLPEAVKLQRRDRLMAVQQEIAFDWNAGQVGRQWQAIVDAPAPRQNGVYLARGTADAPEIDGQIYLTGQKLSPGQIVACEIVAANGYDLAGVQV